MSLEIVTASGARSIPAFRVRRDESPRELRGERLTGTNTVVALGDRGRRPTPLVIEVEVQEASINDTRAEIAGILEDAQAALAVVTPRGLRRVDGITSHRASFNRRAVVLTLSFAPTDGRYRSVEYAATFTGAGSSSVTSSVRAWEFTPAETATVETVRLWSWISQDAARILLWDTDDEEVIASADAADVPAEAWIEAAITPVELTAGVNYVVGARGLTADGNPADLSFKFFSPPDADLAFHSSVTHVRGRTGGQNDEFPTGTNGRYYSIGFRFS